MPPRSPTCFRAVADNETAEAIESQVAHDADKIETLLQAVEYQAQS